jgi:hypothetical protein
MGVRYSAVLCLVLAGCGPRALDAAIARGVDDLSCAPENVQAYRAKGGIIVVTGCGRWARYGCFYSRHDPVCMREGAPEELPLESSDLPQKATDEDD